MKVTNAEPLAFEGTADITQILSFNRQRTYLCLYAHTSDSYITIGGSSLEIKLAEGIWWEPEAVFMNSISLRGAGAKLLVLTSGDLGLDGHTVHFPLTYKTYALGYDGYTLTY